MMVPLNGGTSTYQYRADGMRVAKATGGVTTIYRHDGQMTFQESRSNGERIDQAMGARGIDWMQKTVGGNSSVFFPLYDAHGNMVATLSRAGTGWSLSDQRSYDAWGQVRAGVASGDPSGRYCANLGHKQDDESGLIYMRARYYEPSSGRFISEDPARDGLNWFCYVTNQPITRSDPDGRVGLGDIISGAADEVAEKFAEVQQGKVTLSWAEQTLAKALGKWSAKVAPELVEAMWGEEFLLSARAGAGGIGIQLTGVAGKYAMGIVVQAGEIVVKTYNSFGEHIADNVHIPF